MIHTGTDITLLTLENHMELLLNSEQIVNLATFLSLYFLHLLEN